MLALQVQDECHQNGVFLACLGQYQILDMDDSHVMYLALPRELVYRACTMQPLRCVSF
jgi:hypothetical protein